MNYLEFLEHVINDGIDGVKKDYKPSESRYDGSIKGFEECKGKSVKELSDLLIEARKTAIDHFITANESGDLKSTDDYWYWNARSLEIEWVCNTVSAVLVHTPIITPTARGVMNAARIIGDTKS